MIAIWLLLAVANTMAWLLPARADKLGWGLRVRPSDAHRVHLAQESLWDYPLAVVLINRSPDMRRHTPLEVARRIGDLGVTLVGPNERTLRSHREGIGGDPSEKRSRLASGQHTSSVFLFQDLGYFHLQESGDYELHASLMTAEGLVVAPAVKLRVIEPAHSDILESEPVPLEGQFAKWPKEKQETAVMQQIRIGSRTWLLYRQFQSNENGGKVSATFRVAELPGKVLDLKVEGAFGDWNPLTITYREHTYTKFTTTHVINSVDGKPWTAAEEKHRQEKLKKLTPVPEKK